MAPVKRARQSLTIQKKQEIIQRSDAGASPKELAAEFNSHYSTITTILSQKEKIMSSNVAPGITKIFKSSQRNPQLDEMEKLLYVWIKELEAQDIPCCREFIQEKARQIFTELRVEQEGEEESEEQMVEFLASKNWFQGFKKRTGIHVKKQHGEAASADKIGAEKYVAEFGPMLQEKGYSPDQIFNGDESGLYWKKLPQKAYITKECDKASGHKPMKERFTILFCANASGDLKIRPLLVYKSETPRVFKQEKIIKEKLPVMWRSNKSAWVSTVIFKEWVLQEFAPTVKEYLLKKNLPLQALLVLDNAPVHPGDLQQSLTEEYNFIKIMYLPPNTTSIIQPMDQNIIANCKALYMKYLFQYFFEHCAYSGNTNLKAFWKDFHIVNAIRIIAKAWSEVSVKTLQAGWRNLLKEFPNDNLVQEESIQNSSLISDIISLGESLDITVNEEDIREFTENEIFVDFSVEDLRTIAPKEVENEENEEFAKTASHKKMEKALEKFDEFIQLSRECHPDLAAVAEVEAVAENKVLSHFKTVLGKRVFKQTVISDYFTSKKQKV